jgi:hypothetical protein
MFALAEYADRGDDARRRFQSLREFRVLSLAFGIRERDIERDRPRMEIRDGAHEPRQHLSRQRVAFCFA